MNEAQKYSDGLGFDHNDTATQASFKRHELFSNKKFFLRLRIYVFTENRWTPYDIPESFQNYTIGSNAELADIVIDAPDVDDIQVVLVNTDKHWCIIERGKYSLTTINGFEVHQEIINPGQSCFVSIAGAQMLLHCYISSQKNQYQIPEADPYDKPFDYFLITDKLERRFHSDRPVLIGSDPLCDIRMEGDPFIAMLVPNGKDLYLKTISSTSEFLVPGVADATAKPVLLQQNTAIHIDGVVFLKLNCKKRNNAKARLLPDYSEVQLAFVEVDETGELGEDYRLPEIGETFMFGRSFDNDYILEHEKISRNHAQVTVFEDGIYIIDSSYNGTYINNIRIEEAMAHPGDIVRFADYNYLVCYT